jgi:dihydrofolate synthase / folylpolyglutamate synthase
LRYEEARAFLDRHINAETGLVNLAADDTGTFGRPAAARHQNPPSLDRIKRLLALLGDPQLDTPFVHITGTNGKGSVARMVTELLGTFGSVGTFTSPDMGRVNERIALNGEPISDTAFGELIGDVALAEGAAGSMCSFFELLTAAAYRYFNDVAVDAAVFEVGAGGRWDSTNVGDGGVAVITNIELDHQEWFGNTKLDIAREKVGIVKPGSIAVIGETDPEIQDFLVRESRTAGAAEILINGVDFACDANRTSVGGRLLTLRTPTTSYSGIHLPLHGAHQGDNAALALTAVEAFSGSPLTDVEVANAFGAVRHPGRMEVLQREPLVMLDGAHNPAGARALIRALNDEFTANPGRILIVGFLNGRNAIDMLNALDARAAKAVIICAPPSLRAQHPADVADAARSIGANPIVSVGIEEAIARALSMADEDDCVVICGSLYLVAAARDHLLRK